MSKTGTFSRVKCVRAYTQTKAAAGDQGADCHDVVDKHWIDGGLEPVACPMAAYPQYRASRKSWGINALGSLVVEVEDENGVTGVGVTVGGPAGCQLVEGHLSRFVEGQDPRDVELMWDQMFRATLNYGRKGLPLQAISAVDLALWDLVGKVRGEPVYQLLGGKTKPRLPVYCTTGRPDVAQKLGFVAAKIPCPHGPAEGQEGLEKNVAFFQKWRQAVGPQFPLMLDCYMALTPRYAARLARRLEQLGLKWMEEFLPPDDYEGYKQVREELRDCGVLLTTGEHEYTRYGFQQLLASRCVDILQPDITWVGGLTEARRVVAMAAAENIPVIPHGSSVYSYHLQYAFNNCPVAEFINMSPGADKLTPYFGGLFPDEPLPKDGFIDLPDKPGFGVTLDKSRLTRPYPRSEEESRAQALLNINAPVPEKPIFPL